METRTATINADGIKEREVLFVKYELNQQTDVEGQPSGPTRGGKIYVRVKSRDDGNTDIFKWMCDSKESKSGSISFPNMSGGEMKRLDFSKGYCVEYSETYDSTNSLLQYEEFTITAWEIRVGTISHNNRWTIR